MDRSMAKNRKRVRRYRPSTLTHSAIRRIARPRVELDRGLAWYALWTAARAEQRVEQRLRAAGLATYLPAEVVERVRRGQLVQIDRPAVSRYVFVGLSAAAPQFDAVHEALEEWTGFWPVTLGRLLRTEAGPFRIPASALQCLANAISGPLDANGGLAGVLQPGTRIRPLAGPLCGRMGIVENVRDQRVRALVEMLGGRVAVEFDVDQLEAA